MSLSDLPEHLRSLIQRYVDILSKPGLWLQGLTTREPDDKMIEVAIVSIEEVFDWKEYQRRCINEKKYRDNKSAGSSRGKSKKSRAEIKEELRLREQENKKRATQRAMRIKEQEAREAELEKVVSEAAKRKAARNAVNNYDDRENDDILSSLDHYFDEDKKD